MINEMLALLTAFFIYHGDATWEWWFAWGLMCFLYVLQSIGRAKRQRALEIEEQRRYWEGK